MEDFDYAIDKVLMGAKREEVITGKEKERTAYHEAGHALVAWLTQGSERVHKVTVVPRGRALGVTQFVPEEDRFNIAQHELLAKLAYILGGRAAEHLVYGQFSAGAENDLERATSIARRMVTQWGMSDRIGPVSYKLSDEDPFLGREMHQQRHFSEHTMQVIDEEIVRILHEAAAHAESTLRDNRPKLERLVEALLEKEVLSEREIIDLIGPAVREVAESNGKPDKHALGKRSKKDGEKALIGERSDQGEDEDA
jgi:cell division protease FtsH